METDKRGDRGSRTLKATVEATVHAGSSRRGAVLKQGELHIYTPKKPVRGEANSDAVEIISEYFNVPKSAVSILRGEKSKHKLFRIGGNRAP